MRRIECDRDDWRLAEKGIMFICPDPRCPFYSECPYAARTRCVVKVEKISPELFLWELYNANGIAELDVALHIAVRFGYCDAGRLYVRPKSGMLALMVEYEDGAKEWYHIPPRLLDTINKRLARKTNERTQHD